MISPQIGFKWYVGEASFSQIAGRYDHAFHLGEQLSQRASDLRLLHAGLRVITLASIVLLIQHAHAPSQRERQQAELAQEIYPILTLEAQAWEQADHQLFSTLIDDEIEGDWLDEWDSNWDRPANGRQPFEPQILSISRLTVPADQQLLLVVLLDAREPANWLGVSPLIERRYYRRAEERWLRSVPPTEFWGAPQVYETAHLRFEYMERDATAIEFIADRLEAAYVDAHRLLDAPLPRQKDDSGSSATNALPVENPATGLIGTSVTGISKVDKLTFSIVPRPVSRLPSPGLHQTFTSPTISAIPAQQSHAEYLTHQLAERMSLVVIHRTQIGLLNSYLDRWAPVLQGLQGWVAEKLLNETTVWERQSVDAFLTQNRDIGLLRLGHIGYYRVNRNHIKWQYMASKTLIEHVEAEYGPDSVARMVRGFHSYRSWNSLLQDVLDVSLEEFEASWNRYLDSHYASPAIAPSSLHPQLE